MKFIMEFQLNTKALKFEFLQSMHVSGFTQSKLLFEKA